MPAYQRAFALDKKYRYERVVPIELFNAPMPKLATLIVTRQIIIYSYEKL